MPPSFLRSVPLPRHMVCVMWRSYGDSTKYGGHAPEQSRITDEGADYVRCDRGRAQGGRAQGGQGRQASLSAAHTPTVASTSRLAEPHSLT